jgi:hypothetical protein
VPLRLFLSKRQKKPATHTGRKITASFVDRYKLSRGRDGGEDSKTIAHTKNVILYMLRQTLRHRAPPLAFPSFSSLTVTLPKLAVILRPLYYISSHLSLSATRHKLTFNLLLFSCLTAVYNSDFKCLSICSSHRPMSHVDNILLVTGCA